MPCLVPKCKDCPFLSIHTVGSKGPKNSPFMIVGESPGNEERRAGVPFIGKSGKVLDEALGRMDHPDPYITNAFKCVPLLGKTVKKEEEIVHRAVTACNGNFAQEVSQLESKPKIILAVGAGAIWATTGDHSLKITKERGRLFQSPFASIGVVAAVHPAFLLRGFGSWRQFLADVNLAMRLVNGEAYIQPGTANLHVLTEPSEVEWLAERFQRAEVIAADIETGSLSYLQSRIISDGFSDNGKDVFIIPRELRARVDMNILYRNKARFVWHNGKFDLKFQFHNGTTEARLDDDTMMESYTLDERRGVHDLEQVSKDWLNAPSWKGMLDKYKKKKESYEVIPRDVLYKYQAFDIADTWHLHHILRPQIARQPLAEKLYTRTILPASKLLTRVEMNGFAVDPQVAVENGIRYSAEADKYEAELNQIAIDLRGYGVNPRSPAQLIPLLFDTVAEDGKPIGFGIKSKHRGTDEKILKELPNHPAVVALRKYRKPAKAESTYATPYLATITVVDKKSGKQLVVANEECVIQPDGNVHSTYLIHGTPTGRLSSRDPNLQNIPRDPLIRNQFIARPGRILIEVDLNQAELRSLACLSQDPYLCHIYETEGMSLHEVQRSSSYGDPKDWSLKQIQEYLDMFNLTPETRYNKGKDRIIEEQKMRAKAVNFGIVYGRTAPSLAEEFHVEVAEAMRWIEVWFARFPQAKLFIDVCRRAPRLGKDLVTVFGRRKRHGVVSEAILTALENEAANMPHQSVASDINLHGAIEFEPQMREEYNTNIINLVHDSTVFDAPDDPEICRKVIKLATQTVEAVPPKWGLTRIKFKADPKIGKRWGSLSEPDAKKLMEAA